MNTGQAATTLTLTGIHGPIQIIRYANRIELRNPGHSLKSEDTLGEPGSETRNPTIAAVLHDVNFAETKGSGIRVMRELMEAHGLMPPSFESSRTNDHFVATLLLHHLLEEEDLAWARGLTHEELGREELLALVFVREVGAIDNAAFRGIAGTDTLTASARLRRLRELDLLDMRGKGSRAHYVPGQAFERAAGDHSAPPGDHCTRPGDHHGPPGDHSGDGDVQPAPTEQVPESLRRRLPSARSKPRKPELQDLIIDLCAWRAFRADELAELLGGRDKKKLVRDHLSPMVQDGRLRYTVPHMIKHPDQKYVAAEP